MQRIDTPAVTFDADASGVLGSVKSAVANVLASFPAVGKPAELQKLLGLDWKLSWQLFRVAGQGQGDILSVGPNVPSRVAMDKFLAAAAARGVSASKLDRVRGEIDRFERLVERHAGDRLSFNSMIASAAEVDDEWLVVDTQHRRNAFRAMSHTTGLQAKTKLICGIVRDRPGGGWDMGLLSGYLGLRMFRRLPLVQVFRMREVDPAVRTQVRREPLGLNAAGDGYLLESFSSDPLPPFVMRELDAGWIVGQLENPLVGNLGTSTMLFGTVYRNYPGLTPETPHFDADVTVDKPVELVLNDVLVEPGLMGQFRPRAEAFLGNNLSDASVVPGDLVPLLGDLGVERLGTGPEALANPHVPDYPEMVRASADRLGWDVSGFEAWRVRMEFPVYSATIRMRWG